MEKYFANLIRPRWPPFITAFACFFIILSIGGEYFNYLTLNYFSLEQHYVDDSTYISHISTHYKPANKLTIILLGGSVTREATLPDHEMEKLWFKRFGHEIDFINLGSSNQSIFESLALLTTMKIPENSLIIQQFSYKKLDIGIDVLNKEYLLPRTTHLDYSQLESMLTLSEKLQRILKPELLLYAGPIRNYLGKRGCGYKLLLTKEGRSTCFKERVINRSHYSKKAIMSKLEKREYIWEMQRQIIPNYQKNYTVGLQALKIMQHLAKSKSSSLVFNIYPIDEAEYNINNAVIKTQLYKKILNTVSNLGPIIQYDNNKFNNNDFFDTQHLTNIGKNKFTDIFLQNLHTLSLGEHYGQQYN